MEVEGCDEETLKLKIKKNIEFYYRSAGDDAGRSKSMLPAGTRIPVDNITLPM